MKNEEDEAFDELAKRQGSWGGGFKAKRKMAADKLQEPVAWMSQCPSCGGDCGYLENKGCQYGKKTLPDMLTAQEHQEIVRIVARWDYATEAAIEAYLLGKTRSSK